MLADNFFDRDAKQTAKELLGKIIRKKHGQIFLSAMIIETECYYLKDKASHASLGFTEKRSPLFMPPGTIYMYYARGGDSLNISCRGEGNAVLIKSAYPYTDCLSGADSIETMHMLNPAKNGGMRKTEKLCSGQTLLCRSLGLKVPDWTGKNFEPGFFYFEDAGITPDKIISSKRLGIPPGRDEDMPYRFVFHSYAKYCTSNPLTKKIKDYDIIDNETL